MGGGGGGVGGRQMREFRIFSRIFSPQGQMCSNYFNLLIWGWPLDKLKIGYPRGMFIKFSKRLEIHEFPMLELPSG